MAKNAYMPRTDSGKLSWLKTLNLKLPGYAATLGITPAELALVNACALIFQWAMDLLDAVVTFKEDVTQFKNILRSGPEGTPLTTVPAFPVMPVAPALVAAGIFIYLGRLIQKIKNHANYNISIGEDLGIEGAEVVFDPATLKPIISGRQEATRVEIDWKKLFADAIDIYVDRGDGTGWVFLARDTVPGYTDSFPMPTDKSAVWNYKAIYVISDEQVGQFSDVISVVVKG